MGRLSNFFSKTGDFVQQASDELQRPRQPEQRYQQQSNSQHLQGYRQQYSQQYLPQQTLFQPPLPQEQQFSQNEEHYPQHYHHTPQVVDYQIQQYSQAPQAPSVRDSRTLLSAPTSQVQYSHQTQPTRSTSYNTPSNSQGIVRLASGIRPITECADSPVTFALDWFIHSAAPQFTICSRCYADHILNSPFSAVFTQTHLPAGKPRQCLFSTLRIKEFLWPQALATQNLDELLRYMKTRSDIPVCPEGIPRAGQSWYIAVDRPELCFCPACYEDKIRAGPFGARFRLEVQSQEATCDHSTWFIRRILEAYSKTQNWNGFVAEAFQRLHLKACPKTQLVTGLEATWFVSRRGPDGFQICEACYWDYFRRTPDEQSFHSKRLGPNEQALCLMSQMNFLVPVIRALSLNNLSIFWQAAQGISENPLCEPKGTTGARWYTLPNNPPEFDVCGGCMASIVRSFGLEHHFVVKTSAGPADTLLCCFNIQGFWRALLFLEKLMECAYVGAWQPLGDLAMHLANAPACPKINRQQAAQNRRWWGWNEAHICEECYNISIRGSSLESQFELRGQDIAEPRICDLFSARMRDLYYTACENNDPAGFLDFARQRRQIYLQTMPECDRLLSQAKFALSQAQTLGLAAVTFSAAGHLKDSTWGHAYTVGNSVVGHGYANEELMNAAMADHQMQMTGAAATGPAAVATVGILEKMWKTVE